MIDEETRTAILRLHAQGHGSRKICRALGIARDSVRRIIQSGSSTVPPMVRAERAEPWREQILELYARYEGHLGRVHDALTGLGAAVSYPALTAFCRRHAIGYVPPPPAGHSLFVPGQEVQHDTSPHHAVIAGTRVRVQTASLVLSDFGAGRVSSGTTSPARCSTFVHSCTTGCSRMTCTAIAWITAMACRCTSP